MTCASSFRVDTGTVTAADGVSLSVAEGETVAAGRGVGQRQDGDGAVGAAAQPRAALRLRGRRDPASTAATCSGCPKRTCAIRGDDIAMVFQDPMTSLNPVTPDRRPGRRGRPEHRGGRAARYRDGRLPWPRCGTPGIDDPERRAAQYPHQLSGGLRQRAMIAMALVGRPRC